ncbi:MAG: Molybdate/tungstate transport system ATP-binding protein [Acetothermia bacterium 64_32]|nr:MAG: Molybdate/tungstate transport system ATP-binding protein [Acetothermia bacterium 64_32]MBC7099478.1 ABC transporter ATP-binding protein [Candidatus Bipolaricaulota bacterium]HAF70491.1 molybdenum ABC transporter ATP-binding protein [Candidatus Acetothermia bacterium]
MKGASLVLEDLRVKAGSFLLSGVDLRVRGGGYLVILGPTGAGKTVLLEAVAGLRRPAAGRVLLGGEDVTPLPPERRNVGYVFQDHALFPHLSVFGNIAFGLRLRRLPRRELARRVEGMARLLGIEKLLPRRIEGLSGGERQRVALARALVIQPRALLLDEPLSSLDPARRQELQRLLEHLHQELLPTVLHVTHDFEEAVALGEEIAVLQEGRIAQVGPAEEVFRRPATPEVAEFLGARNVLSGQVSPDGRRFKLDGTELEVVSRLSGPAHAAVRPEDILLSLSPIATSARNCLRGRVMGIERKGPLVYVTVDVPPTFIVAITPESLSELGLAEGMEVYLSFKASAVHVF